MAGYPRSQSVYTYKSKNAVVNIQYHCTVQYFKHCYLYCLLKYYNRMGFALIKNGIDKKSNTITVASKRHKNHSLHSMPAQLKAANGPVVTLPLYSICFITVYKLVIVMWLSANGKGRKWPVSLHTNV